MTIPDQQRPVVDFLAHLTGASPRETHISAIFIGSDTVWKLKKAVRLPFLDFTTVEARAHFLRRELELNRVAAPSLYRDVVGISRNDDGSLCFGEANLVDWVLRMAPIPADDFLDVIVSKGGLTDRLLDDLGDAIAAYHERLQPIPNVNSAGGMLRITEGNVRSALAAGLPRPDVEAWKERMDSTIEAIRPWLDQRSASGFVRRCHGDLHLGNICIWEGKPVPFDALEFDEALATIDVAYDLGFLLMDLDQRAGRAAANRVFNRYVARTGEVPTRGLPVFLSERAMIRAHVLSAMNEDGGAYLSASQRYLRPAMPMVIAIGGLQGTGKSTLARALAPAIGPGPGALIVRSDEIRKRLHGVAPEDRLPPEAYSESANVATNATLVEHVCAAAASGHGVVADATFLDVKVRDAVADAVRNLRVEFIGIWLHAPQSLLENRILNRSGDASDATVEVLRRSIEKDPGPGDWVCVDASDAAEAERRLARIVGV